MIPCKTFRPEVAFCQSPPRRSKALVTILVMLCSPLPADHVLVSPGRGLFNVSVESTLTTPATSAIIRTDPTLSFGFDLQRGIFAVSGMTLTTPVLDYELTTATIGKTEARRRLQTGSWLRSRRSPTQVLALFTPAPPPTPTPLPTPVPTPDPRRLADPGLPLFQRIDRQLTLFTEEQKQYLDSIPDDRLSTTEGLRIRIALLDDQIRLFESAFPPDDMATSQGLEALFRVRQNLLENRRFAHEND